MAEEDFSEGTRKTLFKRKTHIMTKDQKEFWDKMSKIKPAVWKELNTFMDHTKEIMASGGLVNFYKTQLDQMVDTLITSFIDPLVAPLLEAFSPILADLLEKVIPDLQEVIGTLAKLIGNVLAIKLPGGESIGGALAKLLAFSIEWTSPLGIFGKILDILEGLQELFGGLTAAEKESLGRFMEEVIARFGGEERDIWEFY